MENPIYGPHPLEVSPKRELSPEEKRIKLDQAAGSYLRGEISQTVFHRTKDLYEPDYKGMLKVLAANRARFRNEDQPKTILHRIGNKILGADIFSKGS